MTSSGQGDPPSGQGLTLISAGLVCFCAGGLYGWSALISPLQTAFDVSTAQTGLVFSLAIVAFSVAVVATPYLARRLRALRVIAIFGMGGVLCLALAASASSYPFFVVWFSAGFGTVSGAVYITALAIAAQSTRPKTATPVMVATFGVGGAIFGPAWRLLVAAEWGLNALLLLAAALAATSILAWRVAGPTAPGAEPMKRDMAAETPSAVPALVFALIWIAFAFGSIGGLMVLGLASKMMDAGGATVVLSSITLAGIALGNTAGRLSVAGICLIMKPTDSLFVSAGFASIGLMVAAFGSTAWTMSIGLVFVACGYGIMASAIPTVTREIYGPRVFPTVYALIFSAWGVAGLSAPWVAGAIFDRTGSFIVAIYAAFAATFLSAIAALALRHRL